MKTLIEQLKELDAATTWKPIETAPLDGKIIISYWYKLPSHTKYFWDHIVSKWDENIDNWSGISYGQYATHWKPLSDDNHSDTIKAAIAALEKQAKDIEVLRGALSGMIRQHMAYTGQSTASLKNAKQALEQTGE